MKIILIMIGLITGALQSGFAQTETFITNGTVLDSSGNQALSGASVFCQNTTIGQVTNAEGKFALNLPKGGYSLIISYTGYETQEVHINSTNARDLSITLKPKDKTLTEFTVSGSNEVADGLAKYGQFFRDNFIGTTPNAAMCVIENPDALQFYYSKKRNRLKIKSKEDLVITNNALGYKIKYQLDSFAYEYGPDISTYSGYPFFEELQGSEEQQALWKKNRVKAYNGSRLHFIRSWYDSTLKDEGFSLERVDTTKRIMTTFPVKNPYDSIHYSVVDNDDVEIDRRGKFRVIYRNEMPEKKFLTQYKLPQTLRSQISLLDITDGFTIEQNGYFYEQTDIVNSGYWSWEKVAEAVPYDYNPE